MDTSASHQHNTSDCCSSDKKITHDEHEHAYGDSGKSVFRKYAPAVISFILLIVGIAFDYIIQPPFFSGYVRLVWYIIAYIPVGLPVINEAIITIRKGSFFTEFTLMVLATAGAFAIGEYPEAVAVMLFYAVGELFQNVAVSKAKHNIKALLDVRPDTATVLRNGRYQTINPSGVNIGETIQIKAGEKVPLDGEMLSESCNVNTVALTGESTPSAVYKGEQVLVGMLNLDNVIEVKVSRKFEDSSFARILTMVQDATVRKAQTELLIRRFAKIYTPVVFFLALAVMLIPYFFVNNYIFNEWLYRALIFLVISCPCALVISIPLGYFGGIGAASRNGILFKGSNYLDLITKVNTVVMDKTGTLTKGVFQVQDIVAVEMDKTVFMKTVAALESKSTHPIAKAIISYAQNEGEPYEVTNVKEISGHGLTGIVDGDEVLAGNTKLLKKFNISYDVAVDAIVESIVVVAINGEYEGYVLVADKIKEDAQQAIQQMHENGVTQTVMLSGDKDAVTQKVARQLGIDLAYGNLLPENKVQKMEELKQSGDKIIAFVGDGINDAPVLALSDVGIAMGAMGSDVAIETADVVIQTGQPSKVTTAIKIGKATKQVVIQNILLAFGVKAIVLILGAGGLATMWEAVFADVGVALLAILNATRIQRMKFD